MRPIVFPVAIALCSVFGAETAESSGPTTQESMAEYMIRVSAERRGDRPRWQPLSISEQELVRQLNTFRVEHGLEVLEVDARASAATRRHIKRCFEELGDEECREAVWIDKVDPYIGDWDKRGFTATGASEQELLRILKQTPAFTEALLRPDATHVASAVGNRQNGQKWCVVYVIRRLISVDDLVSTWVENGHGSATYFGRSSYRQVRARLYRGRDDPAPHQGEDYSTEVETDEDGSFQLSLFISRFGERDCRVVFYVKNPEDPDYQIAASVGLTVWGSGPN